MIFSVTKGTVRDKLSIVGLFLHKQITKYNAIIRAHHNISFNTVHKYQCQIVKTKRVQ